MYRTAHKKIVIYKASRMNGTELSLLNSRGCTPSYGLYEDVPLDRVRFLVFLTLTGYIISRKPFQKRVYVLISSKNWFVHQLYKSNDYNVNMPYCNCQ